MSGFGPSAASRVFYRCRQGNPEINKNKTDVTTRKKKQQTQKKDCSGHNIENFETIFNKYKNTSIGFNFKTEKVTRSDKNSTSVV